MAEVLAEYLEASGIARRMKFGPLYETWERVLGPELAGRTRIVDVRRNVMRVEVSSSAMMQELAGFRKTEILGALRQALPALYLEDIKFQLGTF